MLCTVLRENTLPDTQQKNAIILCVEDTADFTVYIHSFHRIMHTTLNALICSHAWKTIKCNFFSKLKFIVFLSIYIEFFFLFPLWFQKRFFAPSFLLNRFHEAELKFKKLSHPLVSQPHSSGVYISEQPPVTSMTSLQFRPTALGTQGETNGLHVPSPDEYREAGSTPLGI